ncbi:MAG: hypothetical protein R2851_25400 [Caldilineaceae bacterium]
MGALATSAAALALPEMSWWFLLPLSAGRSRRGAVWAASAGVLKARLGVNEILTTVMLNVIALQLMNFLLRGPMLSDPGTDRSRHQHSQSAALLTQVWLTPGAAHAHALGRSWPWCWRCWFTSSVCTPSAIASAPWVLTPTRCATPVCPCARCWLWP